MRGRKRLVKKCRKTYVGLHGWKKCYEEWGMPWPANPHSVVRAAANKWGRFSK